MTHDRIDRLVRAADRYVARDLHGAEQHLLEEIMATPRAEHDELASRRRHRRRSLVVGVAAAAVLAVTVGVAALVQDGPPPSPRAGVQTGQTGQTGQTENGADKVRYTAAAFKVAKSNPRLLIGEPGWKASRVDGFTDDVGRIEFTKGKRSIEMNWYSADSYQGYFDDRSEVSERSPITIDGTPGSRVSYSDTDIAAMLEPEGSTFAEIRASGFAGTSEVLATFATIKHVDVETWLAALPHEVVLPNETAKIVDEILAEVPVPPGFDHAAVSDLGVNSRYYVGAAVIDEVVCGWLERWRAADDVGDMDDERTAVEALKSARSWRILDEMNALQSTGYSQWPWSLADEVEVGQDPMKYLERFSCLDRK